jgi:hypothetical protein
MKHKLSALHPKYTIIHSCIWKEHIIHIQDKQNLPTKHVVKAKLQ